MSGFINIFYLIMYYRISKLAYQIIMKILDYINNKKAGHIVVGITAPKHHIAALGAEHTGELSI